MVFKKKGKRKKGSSKKSSKRSEGPLDRDERRVMNYVLEHGTVIYSQLERVDKEKGVLIGINLAEREYLDTFMKERPEGATRYFKRKGL